MRILYQRKSWRSRRRRPFLMRSICHARLGPDHTRGTREVRPRVGWASKCESRPQRPRQPHATAFPRKKKKKTREKGKSIPGGIFSRRLMCQKAMKQTSSFFLLVFSFLARLNHKFLPLENASGAVRYLRPLSNEWRAREMERTTFAVSYRVAVELCYYRIVSRGTGNEIVFIFGGCNRFSRRCGRRPGLKVRYLSYFSNHLSGRSRWQARRRVITIEMWGHSAYLSSGPRGLWRGLITPWPIHQIIFGKADSFS